jgi:hypothetical protein
VTARRLATMLIPGMLQLSRKEPVIGAAWLLATLAGYALCFVGVIIHAAYVLSTYRALGGQHRHAALWLLLCLPLFMGAILASHPCSYTQFDTMTGRARDQHSVFGMAWWSTERDTPVSAVLGLHKFSSTREWRYCYGSSYSIWPVVYAIADGDYGPVIATAEVMGRMWEVYELDDATRRKMASDFLSLLQWNDDPSLSRVYYSWIEDLLMSATGPELAVKINVGHVLDVQPREGYSECTVHDLDGKLVRKYKLRGVGREREVFDVEPKREE